MHHAFFVDVGAEETAAVRFQAVDDFFRREVGGFLPTFHDDLAVLGVEGDQDLLGADRGGDVTYHGPGQLVAYPILRLTEWRCSISWYLRTLEQVLIDLLAEYGIHAWREEGHTGVWTARGKVAAIGVGVHSWTTFHGIALNVSTNMDHFNLIVPCGIADRPVASLHLLLDSPPSMDEVRDRFARQFLAHFA